MAGNYTFLVTIADPNGLTATSSASVTVNQTLTAVTMSPQLANLNAGAAQQFTATGYDQFGNALMTQPIFAWMTNVAGGAINSNGLFASPNTTDIGTVTAGYPLEGGGSLSSYSVVIVTDHAPTVATAASRRAGAVPVTTVALAALGADIDTGPGSLTYTWTATTLPSGAAQPTFSANGTNAAQSTTATFSQAGNYTFQVTITDPGGLTATSSVSVTVSQTLTTISLAGHPLTETAFDQFGNPMAGAPGTPGQPAFDSSTDTITSPLALVGSVSISAVSTSSLSISSAISGAGALIVDNQGTVVLSGPNTYTGGTIVSEGTLVLANSSAIAPNMSLTIGADAAGIFGSSVIMTSDATIAMSSASSVATASNTSVATASPLAATAAALPSVALRAPTAGVVVNPGPAVRKVPSPIGPPVALPPRRSAASTPLGIPAESPVVGSSVAERIVGDLAWLGPAASSWNSSDPQHRKAVSIQALETVFAQYGR